MLVLTRKVGESIIIGNNDIVITALGIMGNQMRLGIAANSDVTIHREEIYQKILREQEAANDGIA